MFHFKSAFTRLWVILPICVLLGMIYIPALIYGYFWLWVFSFVALTTLLLRVLLDDALIWASNIECEYKRSWAMSYRFFGKVSLTLLAVCAFPFILAVWLSWAGYINIEHVSAIDMARYGYVLSFFHENHLPDVIDYQSPFVLIVLGVCYFMLLAMISFSIFSFRKMLAVGKVIYSIVKTREDMSNAERAVPMLSNTVSSFFMLMYLLFFYCVFSGETDEFMFMERRYSPSFDNISAMSLYILIILSGLMTFLYNIGIGSLTVSRKRPGRKGAL